MKRRNAKALIACAAIATIGASVLVLRKPATPESAAVPAVSEVRITASQIPARPAPVVVVRAAEEGKAPVRKSKDLSELGVTSAIAEKDLTHDERVRLIAGYSGKALDPESRKNLIDQLLAPDDESGLSRESVLALKNDIINLLGSQPGYHADLTEVLLELRETGSPMMRDYAIQQLSANLKSIAEYDSEAADRVIETFESALRDRSATAAGTALLALAREVADDAVADGDLVAALRKQYADAAATIVGAPDATLSNRIAALSVCGSLGGSDELPTVCALVESASQTHLRTAAIAALGDLVQRGFMPDQPPMDQLQTLARSSDPRLHASASRTLSLITAASPSRSRAQ